MRKVFLRESLDQRIVGAQSCGQIQKHDGPPMGSTRNRMVCQEIHQHFCLGPLRFGQQIHSLGASSRGSITSLECPIFHFCWIGVWTSHWDTFDDHDKRKFN